MNNTRIGIRLIASFIIVAILAGVVGFIGFSGIIDTKKSLDTVAKTYLPSIEALAQVQYNMRNVIVSQRSLPLDATSPESANHDSDVDNDSGH